MARRPLIIVSGPAGSGKSTLIERVIARSGGRLRLATSVTTRQPRPGEVPGVHYHFWTVEQFLKARDEGKFLESAFIHQRDYYGSPLSALPDLVLFRHPTEGRVVLHLGGMARLVYLPPEARLQDVVAFEAAPCNLLLDALIRQLTGGRECYDAGGKHAVQGKAIEPLLASWLACPALQPRPPRSLPSHAVTDELVRQAMAAAREHGAGLHDLLCTATHFVARGLALALRRFLPPDARVDRALLSGGGVRNGLLWHLLQQQLGGIPLARTDEAGIPAELLEAVSAGVLAALTLDAVPGNSPAVTGAAGSRLLGSLTPGSSASWARCVHWMARHLPPPSNH